MIIFLEARIAKDEDPIYTERVSLSVGILRRGVFERARVFFIVPINAAVQAVSQGCPGDIG